jgi:hypothetical protein
MIHKLRCVTLIALSLYTTACAKVDRARPAVEIRTVEVLKPIPTPCLAITDWKALLAKEPARIAALLTGDARHDLDLVAASAIRLRAYTQALQAALRACAG